MFGTISREDIHLVAKPFSTGARLMGALSIGGTNPVLPVIPNTLARDREDKFNRDVYWRLVNRKNIPIKDELRQLNANTLQECADLTVNGHIVTLFPAGGVMDSVTQPWQRGLGRIIKYIPQQEQDNIAIVPFRFEDFSKLRLLHSLIMASKGMVPNPYTITLRLGQQGSISQLLGDTSRLDSVNITETLRKQFVHTFSA